MLFRSRLRYRGSWVDPRGRPVDEEESSGEFASERRVWLVEEGGRGTLGLLTSPHVSSRPVMCKESKYSIQLWTWISFQAIRYETVDVLVVMPRSRDSFIDNFEDVASDHLALSQNAHSGTVTVEVIAVSGQCLQFDLGQLHQALYLILGTVEILDTEGIHSHDLDTGLVTYLHNLGLNVSSARISAIPLDLPSPMPRILGGGLRRFPFCGFGHIVGCRPSRMIHAGELDLV